MVVGTPLERRYTEGPESCEKEPSSRSPALTRRLFINCRFLTGDGSALGLNSRQSARKDGGTLGLCAGGYRHERPPGGTHGGQVERPDYSR